MAVLYIFVMLALFLCALLLQTSGATMISPDSLTQERERIEATLLESPSDLTAQDGEVRVSEQIALTQRASGDFTAALSNLLRAEKFVPDSPRLLYDVGVLEEQMGLYRDAFDAVEQLRKLTSADVKVAYLAARIELDLGRLAQAETDMRAYLQAHPEDATAHFGMGRILQQGQHGSGAKGEFEKSIDLQPVQTESYYQLAQIALGSGDLAEVLRLDQKVLARDPKHGGALTSLGAAYFKMKQYSQAEYYLKSAVDAAPGYQLGHYYYGLDLSRLGKKQEADRELAIAAKMADETNKKEAEHLETNPQ